jgi:hypothetical protein
VHCKRNIGLKLPAFLDPENDILLFSAAKTSRFSSGICHFFIKIIPEQILGAISKTVFMITSTYTIAFNFQVEDSSLIVPLTAEVEVHHSETFYLIKNFKSTSRREQSVLPDIAIKKEDGQWVHIDSEKESHLSSQVGKCIERLEADLGH